MLFRIRIECLMMNVQMLDQSFSCLFGLFGQPAAAKDVLKDLRRCDVELDTMAFSSFLKTLELDGNWRYSLQSLQENGGVNSNIFYFHPYLGKMNPF